MIKIFEVEIIR